MANRFSVDAVFRAVDRVTVPVSRMQNRIQKFTRRSTANFNKLNRAADKFGRGLKRGAMAATAALAITAVAMADVVLTGAKFDQTLTRAGAKLPEFAGGLDKTSDAYKGLAQAAKDVGNETEFSAIQAAEGLDFLAMAGFNLEASIKALPTVADLATVGALGLARATDIATDSLGAFNLLSEDSVEQQKNLARVSNVIALTSIRANTSVEDMFEALKQGAPIAVAAGQSMESVAAAIATMANSGIKGTKGATALKNITLALTDATGKSAKELRRLEVATIGANGEALDAVSIFIDLQKKTKELTGPERVNSFKEIFGKIPVAAAINLANASAKTADFRDELLRMDDVMGGLADTMRDTVSGDIDKFKASIESVKISIFELNEGPIRDVTQGITKWIKAHEELIATNIGDFIQKIIANKDDILLWGARIGKAALFIGTLVIALKTFVLVMTAVNLVMAANPVVLIILGIMALIAVVVLMVRHWDTLKEKFAAMPLIVKAIAASFLLPLAPLLLLVEGARSVIDEWEPIKAFFASLWTDVVAGVKMAVEAVKGLVSLPGLNIIGGIAGGIASFAGRLFGGGDDAGAAAGAPSPQVVTPSERTARSIEESRTTNTSEVTIRDETGRAALTGGSLGRGITLQSTGAF